MIGGGKQFKHINGIIMHVCMCIKSHGHLAPSSSSSTVSTMKNDDVLRKPLVWLAAVTVFTGLYTQSLKKMGATYVLGMFVICCFALPDWSFFNRPLPQWRTLNTLHLNHHYATNHSQSRFKMYPVRLLIFSAVYAFVFYHWWNFISG